MAVITPNTDLYLLKVPLEINDINQLDFASRTAQFNYFNSLPKMVVDDFTYQRKDSTIRFPAQYDEILTYNYVMYRNTEYSNKWFYAFIIKMEYINDNMTMITIKTDTFQTWQFDLTYKPCLVEREHTNDDTIGSNTYPENLELGEMVANGRTVNFGLTNDVQFMTIIDVSMIENYGTNQTLTYSWASGSTPLSYANGIPSGCYHLALVGSSLYTPNPQRVIEVYNEAGLSDAIQNVYILPKNIVNSNDIKEGLTISTTGSAPSDSVTVAMISNTLRDVTHMGTGTITRPTTINGYTPKNNKLLCYPFNYFNLSNNVGTTIPYHYEDFAANIAQHYASFEVDGVFCPSGSIKAVPKDYKNLSYSAGDNRYDYSVAGAKYPICSWNSDSYTNWLTQNAVNMKTEWRTTLIGAAGEVAGGALAGGAGGLVMGAVAAGKNILSLRREQMLAKTSANMVADQVQGNLNAGDITFSKWGSAFTLIPMSVKAEFARTIDDYFSQLGYATNRLKIPNITGRRNWNYVKTISCYIEADIPQEDLAEIKGMFDNGITIWHNPATFADYSQNNDII